MIEVVWSRWALASSVVIHAVVLGVFAVLFALFPGGEPEPEPVEVVFYKAGERVPQPPPPPVPEPEPEPQVEPEPAPVPEPQLAQAEPPPEPEPQPQPVRVAQLQPRPEPPKPRKPVTRPALQPEPEPPKPKRERRAVKTNVLNASVTQPAKVLETQKRKASTGSFGTVETTEAPQRTRSTLRGGTSVGGFTVSDPNDTEAKPSRRAPVRSAGFGASDGGESSGRGSKTSAPVETGGFGSTAKAERPRSKRTVQVEKPDTPVEILSKPTPVYTAEARNQRVQGEVALRVTFVASGEIRVIEVIDGLGHGLDEAAVAAAKQIRFKPARRDGRAVDHTTTLRILFQLV